MPPQPVKVSYNKHRKPINQTVTRYCESLKWAIKQCRHIAVHANSNWKFEPVVSFWSHFVAFGCSKVDDVCVCGYTSLPIEHWQLLHSLKCYDWYENTFSLPKVMLQVNGIFFSWIKSQIDSLPPFNVSVKVQLQLQWLFPARPALQQCCNATTLLRCFIHPLYENGSAFFSIQNVLNFSRAYCRLLLLSVLSLS